MITYKQFLEQQTHQQASLQKLTDRREAANQEQKDFALRTPPEPTQDELAAANIEQFKVGVKKREEQSRERRAEEAQKRNQKNEEN